MPKKYANEDDLVKFKSINAQKKKARRKQFLKESGKKNLEDFRKKELGKIARRKLIAGQPIKSERREALKKGAKPIMAKKIRVVEMPEQTATSKGVSRLVYKLPTPAYKDKGRLNTKMKKEGKKQRYGVLRVKGGFKVEIMRKGIKYNDAKTPQIK